jgi:hypothetical protein
MATVEEVFNQAAEDVKKIKANPSQEELLQVIYHPYSSRGLGAIIDVYWLQSFMGSTNRPQKVTTQHLSQDSST